MFKHYNKLSVVSVLFISALLIFSCAGKKNFKKAIMYDEAGLYEEAANLYMRSLSANRDNIDAPLGLRRTGQMVINDKLGNFSNFYNQGLNREAVYSYMDAQKYHQRAANLGVRLEMDSRHIANFNNAKEIYLSQLYDDGVRALSRESFDSAEPIFSEILSIESNYKDAHDLWITSRYEPIYRNGLTLLSNNKNRNAYFAFDMILKEAGNYKNTAARREEALRNATITLTVLPVYISASNQRSAAVDLHAATISEINLLPTPFYKIINDPIMNALPMLQGVSDPTAILLLIRGAGLQLKADNILIARISRFTEQSSNPTKTERKAWIKQVKERTNESGRKETYTEYVKTTYSEIQRSSNALLRVDFSLLNISNGQILVADYVFVEDNDSMVYAEFSGNFKDLIPGEWRFANRDDASDIMNNNTKAISDLHQLFEAPKTIRTGKLMMDNLLSLSAHQIAARLLHYNPEE
jgi:tetratricopeptide (TPR) repeat protein